MSIESAYLYLAYKFAREESHDLRTKNGAIIVHRGGGVSFGTNRLPTLFHMEERLEAPLKYRYIVHAERDAVAMAAKFGRSTLDATMFCPWAPCIACAQMIIQSGISRLVVHKECHDRTPERWQEEIEKAVELLAEANVKYEQWSGKIGGVNNRFNGEVWEP